MKTNGKAEENDTNRNFATVCAEQCRALCARLAEARESLIAEFKETFELHERLLQLAVNEAEALAWETDYPHLVFPALALEKVRGAVNWNERQQAIRRRSPVLAFAA